MIKVRCCRFHNLFVFFLVLSALSLTSHYLADAAAFATDIVPCQAQQPSENCPTSVDEIQCASLHRGFILNRVQDLSILPFLWIRVEATEPYSPTWEPPPLVRPPIL